MTIRLSVLIQTCAQGLRRCSLALVRSVASWLGVCLLSAACGGVAPDGPRPFAAPDDRAAAERADSAQSVPVIDIAAGRAEFTRRWVPYPSIGGQWGRGPLSNADSCAACHPDHGRGAVSGTEENPGALLRIGLRDRALPDPRYGRQLNTAGLLGRVPAEGVLRIEWHEHALTLQDGETVTLRRPVVRIDDAAYGPLSNAAVLSLRVAPPLAGLGLLEAVPASELERVRAAQRKAGMRGDINRVPHLTHGGPAAGRFGWKASQPDLRQQAAAAFIDDIGVTTSLFTADVCSPVQHACASTETVPHPEAKPAQLALLAAYLRALPPPPPPPARDEHGEALFDRLGCTGCHLSSLRTSRRDTPVIRPYTDLLLHDLGEGLADALGEHAARGAQWRTAPLWGLGRIVPDENGLRLLHDGRARDIQEAILWHGGEAAPMRTAYARLSREERVILLRFLQSL